MSLSICFIKKLHLVKVGTFAWYSIKIHAVSDVQLERRKVDKRSKPTQKLKHANSILEYSEYFCQMSSKSILIILSYTISKFAHFLRHGVIVAFFETQFSNIEVMLCCCAIEATAEGANWRGWYWRAGRDSDVWETTSDRDAAELWPTWLGWVWWQVCIRWWCRDRPHCSHRHNDRVQNINEFYFEEEVRHNRLKAVLFSFWKNSVSILIPFFPIISFQFLISVSQKIPIFILIPLFDCNSYFIS